MKNLKTTLLTAIGLGVGVLFAAWLGIYSFLTSTTTTLHPNPQDVPSVSHADPPPRWAAAVKQGRQFARAGLVEQNLPGLSVAVGVGGDIVWAEGFGWADLEKRVPVAPGMRFRIGHASTTVDYSCFAGAGAFLSTPSDLVRFRLAISSGKLLQPGTVNTLQTPQLLASGEETEYGRS